MFSIASLDSIYIVLLDLLAESGLGQEPEDVSRLRRIFWFLVCEWVVFGVVVQADFPDVIIFEWLVDANGIDSSKF